MLDQLQHPVQLTVRTPSAGIAAVVEVEREIVEFFAARAAAGYSIDGEGSETPSEWFVSRLQRFVADVVNEELAGGSDPRRAVSEAVVAACSYAAPAYYVGRVLQLAEAMPGDRDELLDRLVEYLRAHPVQRENLAGPAHVDSVPEIREGLLEVLRRSAA